MFTIFCFSLNATESHGASPNQFFYQHDNTGHLISQNSVFGNIRYNTTNHYDRNGNLLKQNKVPYIGMSIRDQSTIALKSDNTVWTWGNNAQGQLGDGTNIDKSIPVQVLNLISVIAVSAGNSHNLALKSDGTVWAWGNNSNGGLGDGTNVNRATPVKVQALSDIIAISAGELFSLALKVDGTVWAWGNNTHGELGDGTLISKITPVKVKNISSIIFIYSGDQNGMALKSDGTVWTWGANTFGQLGDGTTTNKSAPVQVQNLLNVVSISAGAYHSVGLKSDGTVWTWGVNTFGQLGDGTTTNKSVPVIVPNLPNIKAVYAGTQHSIALRSDGIVWSWGNNQFGQLGIGSQISSTTIPVQVPTLPIINSLVAGGSSSFAKANDGIVWAWGLNEKGQLGNGTSNLQYKPIQVIGPNINPPDLTAPLVPLNLTSLGTTNTSIVLSWLASSDNVGVSGYDIYNGAYLAGSTNGATTYTLTGLAKNKAYSLRVRAKDSSGNVSSLSSPFNTMTTNSNSDTQAPMMPMNLMSSNATNNGITLTWGASTDNVGVTGYDIYNTSTNTIVGSTTGATTYIVTGLKGMTTYSFIVRARDAAGNVSSLSNTVNFTLDTQTPMMPMNLISSNVTSNGVTLAWGASTDNVGVTGYDIYNTNNGTIYVGSTTGATTYVVTGLKGMTTYNFIVRARDAAGNVSSMSNTVNFTLDTQTPMMPMNLTSSNVTSNGVTLAWGASTDNVGVTGYDIYNTNNGTIYVGSTTGATTYSVTGLAAMTSYNFIVRARDAAGNVSSGSNVVSVNTLTGTLPSDTQAPMTPMNLLSSNTTGTGVTLTWGAATDNVGVTGYDIYKTPDNTIVGSTTGALTYVITGLNGMSPYTFIVRARDAAGNVSSMSNTANLTLDTQSPMTPMNLMSSNATGTGVTLTWGAATDNVGVTGYDIYKTPDYSIVGSTTGALTYVVTGLNGMLPYSFIVRARDVAGNVSSMSNTANLTLDTQSPTTPMNLMSSNATSNGVTLTWGASTDNIGVTRYDIYNTNNFSTYIGSATGTTTYGVTGLAAMTTYNFIVRARDAADNISSMSNTVSFNTNPPDTQLPTAPMNLMSSNTTSNGATLSWGTSTDNVGVTGYDIYNGPTLIVSTIGTVSYTVITGLIPNTTYSFTVQAKDAVGNLSSTSNMLTVMTSP